MQGRRIFVEELLESLERMIGSIEEREVIDPGFAVVHEIADQLKEEVEALHED